MMSSDIRSQLNSLTECSVCTETFRDPRILPCVHTYCLKCIQGFSKDKQPGDDVPCPICRKPFTLSHNGAEDLPKNFFIEQLKDVAVTSDKHCEGCWDNRTNPASKTQAVMYCVECEQRLCDTWIEVHRRLRTTRGHTLLTIDDNDSMRAAIRESKTIRCGQHRTRAIEMYCLSCKEAICVMCFVELHKTHE